VSFTLGLHQHTYQYQGTVLYSRCGHCSVHSIVKRNVTVFLQYFCHSVLHSSCCGGHYSLLALFSTKELVDLWLFYFIFWLHGQLSVFYGFLTR